MLAVHPGADSYVQIVEPSEGPGCDELERGGEGAVLEVGFEVGDIEQAVHRLRGLGIDPVDVSGNQISVSYLTSSFGNRYVFFRPIDMSGTRTELIQVMSPLRQSKVGH